MVLIIADWEADIGLYRDLHESTSNAKWKKRELSRTTKRPLNVRIRNLKKPPVKNQMVWNVSGVL